MSVALIVEDKVENAYYLRALLEGHGWKVESARNGAEALVKAQQAPPDIVISDLLMPVMDGYTLLRHWKKDDRLKRVPFIVYTATYTDAEDEALALELGADAFVLKPTEPEDFLARVREVQRLATPARPSYQSGAVAEDEVLEHYSETLIRKLERKTLELERSNRALRVEEAELRLRDRAIQSVSQGIVITDARSPDNPIIYASPGFERLTGFTAQEVIGKNCRLLQGPGTDAVEIERLSAARRAGRGCTVELLNYRKDGSNFWNQLTVSPVAGADGELAHFVEVQTDVTERRQLEQQLRQAQKMEAVGQLAAGVAHDFNNLLSVILSYAQLTKSVLQPDTPIHADMAEIEQAAKRAANLTRQLLAFSRRQVLEPRVMDLGQLLTGIEPMLRRLLGEDIELSLLSANPLGRVHVDPSQVEQIVMNLAVNARDAMPLGGKLTIETVNVQLDARHVAEDHDVVPGPHVMLAVTDTGTGMDAKTQERIFEPFFTTKELGKGTGLGLSTVFGIVQQSRGHIRVDSELDRGTTFRVYLPIVERALDTVGAPLPVPVALDGSETILLVEDDDQVRGLARAILQRQGYTVLDAQNGGEAFLTCEQYAARIDLLLVDVVMPRMSGQQLAERLAPVRPEMKVLFMSGYTESSVIHQGVLDAGVAFLSKPITPDALLRKVRDLLGPGQREVSKAH
jgi:PAS domain S-box-containing protein